MSAKPSAYAMERAAEEIGPDVLVRFNRAQLAARFDRVLAPLREAMLAEAREIDADERFHYPCANVVINAPLALVQLDMETRLRTYHKLLDIIGYEGPEMEIKQGPRP